MSSRSASLKTASPEAGSRSISALFPSWCDWRGNIIFSYPLSIYGQATCLQVALIVLLNPQKHLVDQFHKFGITTMYDELLRFRISVASVMEKGDREIAEFDCKQGLVQMVAANNLDTQI